MKLVCSSSILQEWWEWWDSFLSSRSMYSLIRTEPNVEPWGTPWNIKVTSQGIVGKLVPYCWLTNDQLKCDWTFKSINERICRFCVSWMRFPKLLLFKGSPKIFKISKDFWESERDLYKNPKILMRFSDDIRMFHQTKWVTTQDSRSDSPFNIIKCVVYHW